MSDPGGSSEKQSFTNAVAAPDRRRYPRYSVHLPLELHVEGSNVPMRLETTDISRNGCYIETHMPFSVGTKIEAKLWLGGTRVLARGRIVTSHPQFGNGIMFLEFQDDGQERLQTFLDSLTIT